MRETVVETRLRILTNVWICIDLDFDRDEEMS